MPKKSTIIGLLFALLTITVVSLNTAKAITPEDAERKLAAGEYKEAIPSEEYTSSELIAIADPPLIVINCMEELNMKEWQFKASDFKLPDLNEKNTDFDFRMEFEKARTRYHNAVKCVFEKATFDILTSAGENRIQDLNTPKKACIKQELLVSLLTDTGPQELLKPMLDLYSDVNHGYAKYLIDLLKERKDVKFSSNDFSVLLKRANFFDLLVENEIQDALVALDQAFQSLKEMRSAFVMHVHFQCMLLNLEDFRRVLSNLRKAVITIPPLFSDCSLTKQ